MRALAGGRHEATLRFVEVPRGLQLHPEAGLVAEEMRQANRGVRGDRTPAANELAPAEVNLVRPGVLQFKELEIGDVRVEVDFRDQEREWVV